MILIWFYAFLISFIASLEMLFNSFSRESHNSNTGLRRKKSALLLFIRVTDFFESVYSETGKPNTSIITDTVKKFTTYKMPETCVI